MKNMKVSLKLIVSFLIVVAFTAAVGAVGIYGMWDINVGSNTMYEQQTRPLGDLAYAIEYFQRLRVQVRNAILSAGDAAALNEVQSDVNDRYRQFSESMALYEPTLVSEEGMRLFRDSMSDAQRFMDGMDQIMASARADEDREVLMGMLADIGRYADTVADNLTNLLVLRLDQAAETDESNDATFSTMLTLNLIIIAVVIVIAMAIAVYISRLISKPLVVMTDFMKKAAKTGDIEFSAEESAAVQLYSKNKDELGQCLEATAEFVHEINRKMDKLEKVANGDLTIEVSILSPDDKIGKTLTKVVENLNSMFSEINTASGQVSAGSKQIANGAQALAQGSTQQAASVEQLSASISEIAERTKDNAATAGKTAQMSNNIRESAEKGSRQMDEMITAVSEINEASKSISKIIKTIDDIAFQTNILALNAAVEAARAGQRGKGFAVVAEEVRNLASKSAEAAKDTGTMIQNSMEKAELGSRIASETAESLSEIVTGISESSKLITEIAQASEAQSQGISQVNTGIDQVAQVVQQNSATAQESSAASQQMSGQSDMLQQLIAQFKLKEMGSEFRSLPSSSATKKAPQLVSENTSQPPHATDDDFGKY